ncbi:hypothetical protein GOZ78_07610 [Agrobacterium vitis]|uniref:Uncharacterized protein n=2 Tax=Agrobacterium vitis TaxID=373 RepID=A0ABD6GGS5_AGRVI|nr:hypothetical protein [Agrobacterium vitis]MUO80123.1 hypothetical protein [Agrobacterium vitis]MUO97768.1 hypothetical protein [Agrobacterium vitis]MUP07969.1 hypothetical protein [Agrobacterium vitis]MUZ82559.1 hypothetical protein [Agrobacterium vitis]MVA09900.1 hypothetical protein [Agrobacterium vitis]
MKLAWVAVIAVVHLQGMTLPVSADDLYSASPDVICKREMIYLDVWKAQSVIVNVDYDQAGQGRLHVNNRSWLKITSDQQRAIAIAAFCPVAVRFGKGELIVSSNDETVWGSVVNGVWHSRLAP